ncbi:hypothetical protein M0804_003790 [Polistes exclamans]|nr:hypothetical protein M0804_003790 [Polistes exclamans]
MLSNMETKGTAMRMGIENQSGDVNVSRPLDRRPTSSSKLEEEAEAEEEEEEEEDEEEDEEEVEEETRPSAARFGRSAHRKKLLVTIIVAKGGLNTPALAAP